MSNKSYQRGSDAIARGIRQDFTKADEIRAGRMLDRMNADMQRLETENETLKSELEKARAAFQRQVVYKNAAQEEAREARKEADSNHKMMMDVLKTALDLRQAHQKLSAIVRDNMTPDQYHEARARAAETYPELFKAQG